MTLTATAPHIARIECWPAPHEIDPRAAATLRAARASLPGVHHVATANVFLIESMLETQDLQRVAHELLTDPITQSPHTGIRPAQDHGNHTVTTIEVHYLPGVMDPVADSTQAALAEMFAHADHPTPQVRTALRYDFTHDPTVTAEDLRVFGEQHLSNPVIQQTHTHPYFPDTFLRGTPYKLQLKHINITTLDDQGLTRLSRDGHLFLSLHEMKSIQAYYQSAHREPTDIELETFAQTWSEHCVHKTLKSTVTYTGPAAEAQQHLTRPHHTLNDDGSVTIQNLLKATVAAATFKLREEPDIAPWLVSVFDDNAGIIKLDDTHGIAIKVETHNHPSALEPYGGAATGAGGCIRDIIGTGLAAKPIANTDVFCVAPPTLAKQQLPKGVLHPRRTLTRVVDGVRDYGNRMGIPTVNGAVAFHDDYVANPLVFCGCVGIIPLDKCFGKAKPGDHIVALGGRTGRDGIHGATFSSAELTDTHADEFSHAVQIGNAITEKKLLDVILQARDHHQGTLFTAITDCGAGGFSSAIGEMGEKTGAHVQLDAIPTKYDGLSYTELWISEAQERMILAVPEASLQTFRQLCNNEDVELSVLGTFGLERDGDPLLRLSYQGTQVGELSMHLLHGSIPMPTRNATWQPAAPALLPPADTLDLEHTLTQLLAHPNLASKHWIIRQYDHEVQGGSVVKPLTGPKQDGPSDAAVLRPKLSSNTAIAIACGLAPWLSEKTPGGDSYQATLHAIDEAVRNAVCVGADPARIAILDNFCWPSCNDPVNMGSLVRAAHACYDGAIAYRTPFVSGKDSLHNQFTTEDGKLITIPATLLVTALGIVHDANHAVTMDAKQAGNALFLVGITTPALGGSHLTQLTNHGGGPIPHVDLTAGPRNAHAVASLIKQQLVASAHDCSDGGLLCAAAEMAFAGRVGLDLDVTAMPTHGETSLAVKCFAETPSRYLLEVQPQHQDAVVRALRQTNTPFAQVGTFAQHSRVTLRTAPLGQVLDTPLETLLHAWRSTLDW